ncbi:MAG: hypothetical protein HY706_16210 [Candidatus Hydrogenedentes bacterium]|nr:hypothetical protein [Candidatus Hydrogenedentota bacterium]
MMTLYMVCAILGGVILLCQFLLTLLGLGDHQFGDVGHDMGDTSGHDHAAAGHSDADASWFFSVLSFRSVVAAIAFFGLGGLAAQSSHLPSYLGFMTAMGAGAVALFVVAWLMHLLGNLRAEGTVHIEHAIGGAGTVYLTIPSKRAGKGKVLLNLQSRTMEYEAITADQELPTGTPVVVVGVLGPNVVEVAAASEAGR